VALLETEAIIGRYLEDDQQRQREKKGRKEKEDRGPELAISDNNHAGVFFLSAARKNKARRVRDSENMKKVLLCYVEDGSSASCRTDSIVLPFYRCERRALSAVCPQSQKRRIDADARYRHEVPKGHLADAR
jgi:hypothetical protein